MLVFLFSVYIKYLNVKKIRTEHEEYTPTILII